MANGLPECPSHLSAYVFSKCPNVTNLPANMKFILEIDVKFVKALACLVSGLCVLEHLLRR